MKPRIRPLTDSDEITSWPIDDCRLGDTIMVWNKLTNQVGQYLLVSVNPHYIQRDKTEAGG